VACACGALKETVGDCGSAGGAGDVQGTLLLLLKHIMHGSFSKTRLSSTFKVTDMMSLRRKVRGGLDSRRKVVASRNYEILPRWSANERSSLSSCTQ
jgi:hypothetical protein